MAEVVALLTVVGKQLLSLRALRVSAYEDVRRALARVVTGRSGGHRRAVDSDACSEAIARRGIRWRDTRDAGECAVRVVVEDVGRVARGVARANDDRVPMPVEIGHLHRTTERQLANLLPLARRQLKDVDRAA